MLACLRRHHTGSESAIAVILQATCGSAWRCGHAPSPTSLITDTVYKYNVQLWMN
jgi:hypothetical protein